MSDNTLDTADEDEDDFDVSEVLNTLNMAQKKYLVELLGEVDERHRYNQIYTLFPDTGPLRRELYAKHVEFMEAGAQYRERCFMAGNRVGKSLLGGYELSVHATGLYPSWWKGKRFDGPIRAYAAGTSNERTRDIIQPILLGPIHDMGSGLLPKANIFDSNGKSMTTNRPGIPGAKQDIFVKHVSGGVSQITLKSFEQKREGFEGTAQHFIWLDEECPMDIYSECLTRTMTTQGSVMLTFTPLKGLTDVVMQFLPGGQYPKTKNGCGEVESR